MVLAMIKHERFQSTLIGVPVALGAFAVLGTVAALWENPFFIRMVPAGPWEISLLAAQSILLGAFFALRPMTCSAWSGTSGGILGFFGIACPVCNKVLMLLFGGDLLLTYFEPYRMYLAGFGVVVTALAVFWVLRVRRRIAFGAEPAANQPA